MNHTATIQDHSDHTADGADVCNMTVDEWVESDSPVEIVLRRKRDGVEIRLCPTADSYRAAVKAGVIALMPSEVLSLINAASEAGDDPEKRAALEALIDRAVVVKQCIPGAKLSKLLGFTEENA